MIEELHRAPQRFEFFQALELLLGMEPDPEGSAPSGEAGRLQEFPGIRFRVPPTLRFPSADLARIATGKRGGVEVYATIQSLVGSSGPLPQHYAELVIRRSSLNDYSLRDFLDIFHQRAIVLLHGSWAKFRLAPNRSRAMRSGREDKITRAVFSLAGLGTTGLRNRTAFSDGVWSYYAGRFASPVRSASGLEQLLSEMLEYPISVDQFVGRWLELDQESCASLGARSEKLALGQGFSLGSRVWDIQSKFRINIGPISYRQYRSIMKGSTGYKALRDLIRAYAGPHLECDLRISVDHTSILPLRLAKAGDSGAALGSTTWLRAGDGPLPAAGRVLLEGSQAS